jgi:hypothetical protein
MWGLWGTFAIATLLPRALLMLFIRPMSWNMLMVQRWLSELGAHGRTNRSLAFQPRFGIWVDSSSHPLPSPRLGLRARVTPTKCRKAGIQPVSDLSRLSPRARCSFGVLSERTISCSPSASPWICSRTSGDREWPPFECSCESSADCLGGGSRLIRSTWELFFETILVKRFSEVERVTKCGAPGPLRRATLRRGRQAPIRSGTISRNQRHG